MDSTFPADLAGGLLSLPESALSLLLALIPYWLAALAGLLIGWSWCPRWAPAPALLLLAARGRCRLVLTVPPGLGARRLWLGLTALSFFSLLNRIFRRLKPSSPKSATVQLGQPQPSELLVDDGFGADSLLSDEDEQPGIADSDLHTLISYIEEKDGGPSWQLLMEESTATLTYQAWRRDSEFGPTQYRTRTVFENASPDVVRDFFWDDEFRTKWDDMLIYFQTLRECPRTGTMIVHWIRKFPFFCSDREYIIVRRIWESRFSYYCITMGTPYPALPRHRKPRRVDLYYSSWRVRAVESKSGGHLTASEVLLFHHEEMGIPKELAKIGVQRGMRGLVKKMDLGMQAYLMARTNGSPTSRYAFMARISSKIPTSQRSLLPELEADGAEKERNEEQQQLETLKFKRRKNIVKWLVVGGVLIVCGLTRGNIGRGIFLGIMQSFQKSCKKKNNRQDSEVG